jgi:hypothetical protein
MLVDIAADLAVLLVAGALDWASSECFGFPCQLLLHQLLHVR